MSCIVLYCNIQVWYGRPMEGYGRLEIRSGRWFGVIYLCHCMGLGDPVILRDFVVLGGSVLPVLANGEGMKAPDHE